MPPSAATPQAPVSTNYFDEAIRVSRRPGDTMTLMATFGVLTALVFVGIMMTSTYLIAVLIGLIVWTMFLIRVQISSTIGNAFRVQSGRYSYLNDLLKEVSMNLGAPPVELFVVKDAEPNTVAISSWGRHIIIIDAETLENLTQEECRAILVHEMAHIIYGSAGISSYIRPLSEKIQIMAIGSAIEWVFGFWSRRSEVTADRLAIAYTRNPEVVISALVKMTVGGQFAQFIGAENVLSQDNAERGLMRTIAETSTDHPYLITRVLELLRFGEELGIVSQQNIRDYLQTRKKRSLKRA